MFNLERLKAIAKPVPPEVLEARRKRAEERKRYASAEEYAQAKLKEWKENNNK